MKDFVVYTAISNGYDSLKCPPKLWMPDADFVAFLDKPQDAPGWNLQPLYRRFHDPCRNAKIHKLLPHRYFPDAHYSLWIDGSVEIVSLLPLALWPDKYLRRHDLVVFKHRSRRCAYDEAAVCLDGNRDSSAVINRQMNKYCSEGYPPRNGLAECTVLFRRHTSKIERFNEAWYAEIKAYSRRDQLSFNYTARKVGLKFNYFPGNMLNNPHFNWLPHIAPRIPMYD